ncbi:DNA invertase Pin-like site-specific DNA recombinase [Bradyrhizobium sp. JR3.5]
MGIVGITDLRRLHGCIDITGLRRCRGHDHLLRRSENVQRCHAGEGLQIPPPSKRISNRPRRFVQHNTCGCRPMSSDPQKYSIDIQVAAIAVYAARRGMEIVRTYSDPRRSGLTIARRKGLQELIDDVDSGRSDFDCVLVFDISRWGRFQDTDESAFYEFICRRAGISVHYCSEEFENDGSLSSVILKNLKRAGAAGFSRDLSRNTFMGQSNIVDRGYWRGGAAPYGLRRMLVDANRKRKGSAGARPAEELEI